MDIARTEAGSEESPPVASLTARALALLGDHWTLYILQRVFLGERRYQDIHDSINASDSILSNRLKTLTEGGLLAKTPYKDGRVRYEYRLTTTGKATWRIFVAAHSWENSWLDPIDGLRPVLIHSQCGHLAHPQLICGKCDLPVTARDTSVTRSGATLSYASALPRRHRQNRTLALDGSDPYAFRTETMEILGDRWNTALASAAHIGIRRFSDFERFLGIPPTVLSARLSRFVELNILRVQELAGSNRRSDYRLTDKGRDLAAILIQIVRWADENLRTGEPASIEISHDACGRKLLPEYRCTHCEQRLRRREARFELRECRSS